VALEEELMTVIEEICRPFIRSSEEDEWTRIQDSITRKQEQNTLAQRAHRVFDIRGFGVYRLIVREGRNRYGRARKVVRKMHHVMHPAGKTKQNRIIFQQEAGQGPGDETSRNGADSTLTEF
jgi:hypothetical protein